MAADGQVVFSVELDETALMGGMARLQTALAALGQATLAALDIGTQGVGAALAAGSQWIGSFALGVSGNKNAAVATKNAVETATAAARPAAASGGFSVGENMVAGIASGARSNGNTLNAALAAIVRNALNAAKRAAGIASPSRLFHNEVGRYLALGVQTGFVDTMQAAVLPAMGKSVAQSVASVQKALSGTLLSGVRGALSQAVALPDVAAMGAAALRGSAAAQPASAGAVPPSGMGNTTVHQNITFESAMQAPDEIARAIRRQATYGLAAARR